MKNKQYPWYEVPMISNLRELVEIHNSSIPEKSAFTYRKNGAVIRKTFREFSDEVTAMGEYLIRRYKGRHIALLGENSYEWLVVYFAIVNTGNVAVPIDPQREMGDILGLLQKSDCTVVYCSQIYEDIAEAVKKECAGVGSIHMLSEIEGWLTEGRNILLHQDSQYRSYDIDQDAPATIFFTSGTTGDSKGVVLSHKNMTSDIRAATQAYHLKGDTVEVLPFTHAFGLVVGIMMIYFYGVSTHINHSLKYIMKDLQEFRPQTLILVPLYVETFQKQIMDTVKKQGALKKFQLALKLIGLADKAGIDIRHKFLGEITAKFGGRLEYIICGGAPLNPFYVNQFRKYGITVLNGYGITECSPVIAVNRNNYYMDGSVGPVSPGCEVKFAEDGEILVRGDIVMKGYYKDDKATEDAFSDGWYHTGDIGYLRDGFLFINGRSKNLIILSNGENVSPEGIEQSLLERDLFLEAVVYGDGTYLAAEIYPDYEKLDGRNAQEEVEKLVIQWNRTQPAYKQIKKVTVRREEFDKTATKKIKRGNRNGY